MTSPALPPFQLTGTDGSARAGLLALPRGQVRTPAFMPVGTQAAVKALAPDDVRGVGADIILANTYHLMLRPGADALARLGGVSHFMRWDGPLLTDSGGFQIYSLAAQRTLSADGVTFRSHIDGSAHTLTPERAIALQRQFGSDISMALDVCAGYDAGAAAQLQATELTHAWLSRNVAAFRSADAPRDGRLLFGICQGGFDADRRAASAAVISAADVDGCAIGGLSVGEPKAVMATMLEASLSALPHAKPRYLMGVGSPEDLWNGVAAGVDMFDCVLPTRVARRGAVYTPQGRVAITAARYRELDEPLDPTCDCYACRTFSAAYIHHLFRVGELLAYRLATIHNLRFIARQMEAMRAAIAAGDFLAARTAFLANYRAADQATAAEQRARHRAALARR